MSKSNITLDDVQVMIQRIEQIDRQHSMLSDAANEQFRDWSTQAQTAPDRVCLAILEWSLDTLDGYIRLLNVQQTEIAQYNDEMKEIEAKHRFQIEDLRQKLQLDGASVTLQERPRRIQVRSQVQLAVLRLMATGMNRSWRIQQNVVDAGVSQSMASVRHSLQRLEEKGLLRDYEHQSGWSPVRGGRRRLITLTADGQVWCRQVFGDEPEVSEIDVMKEKHSSVSHAVGILEARDLLRMHGYQVDDDPAPVLARHDQRWGRRVDPDLTVMIGDREWPVEVQREVAQRRTAAKWSKVLNLAGRLVLILFNEGKRRDQEKILHQATRNNELPVGDIWLTSLEAMESESWEWSRIVSSRK